MESRKIVMLGGGGVGKSALTIQYVQEQFVDEYDPTIEDSYRRQTLIDEEIAILEILDTAGQEEYASMRDQYLLAGEGFVCVYSITSRSTFNEIEQFIQGILRAKDKNQGEVPIVLVGNKADLEKYREVTTGEGSELAKSLGIANFFETSAKSRQNVQQVFHAITRQIRKSKAGQPLRK